ncbi:MAG: monofunctional biosynthetic peptidoglycan transglycosylase [Gammaproteobacteria bacterium HGW-Gammaproteobacteria-3]|nr:MAG: monofunctional biosynthetic peptidoglycan transglycosylase [Gammaproteobacteria bacterium HGW-Gammaproteobacteria-3]
MNKPRKSSTQPPQKKTFSVRRRLARLTFYLGLFFSISSLILVALLRFIPAPTSAFMLHRHIDDFSNDAAFQPIHYRWIRYDHISAYAVGAVIAAEDQRFFQHHGFDTDEIYKALNTYFEGGKLRGASTLSQQVAKNLFLSPARAFWRKGLEIWFTVLIEALWPKQRIIEMYLNIAEFGDHLFGIEAAARHYFGIPARQLSAQQAALLAATLPNPLKLQADRPSHYLYQRQAWILRQMKNLGYRH